MKKIYEKIGWVFLTLNLLASVYLIILWPSKINYYDCGSYNSLTGPRSLFCWRFHDSNHWVYLCLWILVTFFIQVSISLIRKKNIGKALIIHTMTIIGLTIFGVIFLGFSDPFNTGAAKVGVLGVGPSEFDPAVALMLFFFVSGTNLLTEIALRVYCVLNKRKYENVVSNK